MRRLHPSRLGLGAAAAALAVAAAAVATLHGIYYCGEYEPAAIRITGVALVVALPLWCLGTGFSVTSQSRRRWLVVVALVELAAGIAILLYLRQQTAWFSHGQIICK
jgi:hypothetical protein